MNLRVSALLGTLVAVLPPTSIVSAQWQLGAGAHFSDGVSINVHAVVPLADSADLEHSIRPQVSYGFAGLPAASVSYVLSQTPTDSTVKPYLGLGAGVSFLTGPIDAVLVSFHGISGFEFPVADLMAAFTEATVTTSAIATGISIGAGVRYMFGGWQ